MPNNISGGSGAGPAPEQAVEPVSTGPLAGGGGAGPAPQEIVGQLVPSYRQRQWCRVCSSGYVGPVSAKLPAEAVVPGLLPNKQWSQRNTESISGANPAP